MDHKNNTYVYVKCRTEIFEVSLNSLKFSSVLSDSFAANAIPVVTTFRLDCRPSEFHVLLDFFRDNPGYTSNIQPEGLKGIGNLWTALKVNGGLKFSDCKSNH